MVTPIEVLDSAVKIGLGALIGGVVSYMVARLNLEKDRSVRRREILEAIVEQVEKASETFMSESVPFSERDAGFTEFLKQIPGIEAKLLLLGDKRSLRALRDYREAYESLQKEAKDNKEGTDNPAYWKEVGMKRSQDYLDYSREMFFDKISEAYKRL
jgi:hypothetical protein